jgi:nicotinamide-nucleotide amidase
LETLFEHAKRLGALLKGRKETVSIAESSSGGLISAALLSVSGASTYFKGSCMLYTKDSRKKLLGLLDEMAMMRGANEEYAMIIAKAVRKKLTSTWGVCETGATGPSGNRYGDAAGHVCIAIAGPKNVAMTLETGISDREENMWIFAQTTLDFLKSQLKDKVV